MVKKYRGRYDVLGRAALLVMTLIWGTSFLMQKNTLSEVPTLYLLAFRFTGATVTIFLFFIKQMKNFDWQYVWNGIVLGVLLFLGYVLQTYGLYYTTPSKNAFLSAIYCVLVPFIGWIVFHKKPDGYNVLAAFICFGGVALVALKEDLTMSFGDMLTIMSGLFYGVHIVMSSKYIEGRSVAVLTFVQFCTAMILSWAFALTNAVFPTHISTGSIVSIVYLSVMCTAVCFVLQMFGQKHTPPTTTALIMTLESVFGTIFSVWFGNEHLNSKLICGFVLIFVAILISDTKLSFLHRGGRGGGEPPETKLFD